MPEGDTVHKGAVILRAALCGVALQALQGRGAEPLFERPPGVVAVSALGKHLLIDLDNGWTLRIHLGMHGAWYRYPRPWTRSGEVHLLLETPGEALVLRQAKEVERLRTADKPRHPVLSGLGPDLLGPEPDWERLAERVLAHPGCLGEALLDQRLACGLGNVYRNELCFLGPLRTDLPAWHPHRGTSPLTPVQALTRQEVIDIYRRGRRLMQQNLGGWPRTTTFDPRLATPELRRARCWVYGRAPLPCIRCRRRLQRRGSDGDTRLTFWCPVCQPLGRWSPDCSAARLLLPEK